MTIPPNFHQKEVRALLEDDWLVPRKVRHFLRIRHNVFINGTVSQFGDIVKSGDSVTLEFEESDYTIPQINLATSESIVPLYETEHYIIVNKPAGIKTHPNQPDETDTLLNQLATYLSPQNTYPYVIHRLDKETSGVILFAENPFSLPILSRMMEQRKIKRTYYALVEGIIEENSFEISKKIGRHRHDRRKRTIDDYHGKSATTHVTVIDRNLKKKRTLIQCELDTGRTHQIRVHLESIHHPVVNDPLYNRDPNNGALLLHAKELSFTDPLSNKRIHCTTNLPDYFLL